MSVKPLIPPTALFRFAITCRHVEAAALTTAQTLEERYRLPTLGELDGKPVFAEMRLAWNPQGFYFRLNVQGKRTPPWCRETRMDASDGLHLWLDTRGTFNVHRASRFCHRFFFMPTGGGQRLANPMADQLLINRARENANPVRPGVLLCGSQVSVGGYEMWGRIPASALTGFDPVESPRLGFMYAVLDRELGTQTLGVHPMFPFDEDPSLWAGLDLDPPAK